MRLDTKAWKAAIDETRMKEGHVLALQAEAADIWNAALDAVALRLEHRQDLVPMKVMIRLPVTFRQARKFIEQMSSQGYEAVQENDGSDGMENWYFRVDGKISTDYEVHFLKSQRKAFVSIRPA